MFFLGFWGLKPYKKGEGLELRELTINFPGTIGNPANHGSYRVAEFPKSYLSPVEQPATGNPFEWHKPLEILFHRNPDWCEGSCNAKTANAGWLLNATETHAPRFFPIVVHTHAIDHPVRKKSFETVPAHFLVATYTWYLQFSWK